jgi:hypothetical protein
MLQAQKKEAARLWDVCVHSGSFQSTVFNFSSIVRTCGGTKAVMSPPSKGKSSPLPQELADNDAHRVSGYSKENKAPKEHNGPTVGLAAL